MKRLFALLLCLLMVSAVIVSCKGSSGGSEDTTAASTEGTTTGDTTTEGTESLPPQTTELSDGLDGVTFDGTTINVPYRTEMQIWYEGAEEGNVVYQSIYNANLAVEDRLQVKRNFIPLADAVLTSTITNSIMSDLNEYDYVSVDQYYGAHHVAAGVYADLSDAEYLDFTKPWYYQDYMSACNLGKDCVFLIAGAGQADNAEDLAGIDIKINGVERNDPAGARAERFVQAPDLDNGSLVHRFTCPERIKNQSEPPARGRKMSLFLLVYTEKNFSSIPVPTLSAKGKQTHTVPCERGELLVAAERAKRKMLWRTCGEGDGGTKKRRHFAREACIEI